VDFSGCTGLTDLEFGNKLEKIRMQAFDHCISLRRIKMPSVRTIRMWAFRNCTQLIDVDLPEGLETVGQSAFVNCPSLRRIAMPLKDDIVIEDDVFCDCPNLKTVDLVGGDPQNHCLFTSGELED
jgi:hypothetical protein